MTSIGVMEVGPQSRDWADLATELQLLILGRLHIKEYVRFGAVCVSWYHTVRAKLVSPAPHLPWLLVRKAMFDPFIAMFDPFIDQEDFRIQEEKHGDLLGSTSNGQMIYHDTKTNDLLVVNPITGSRLPFPSVTTLKVELVVIDSAAALLSRSSTTAVAINYSYGRFEPVASSLGLPDSFQGVHEAVAFSRPGDHKWTYLGKSTFACSMIFHKELLYMLTADHRTLVWDLWVRPTPSRPVVLSPNDVVKFPHVDPDNCFLVESSSGNDLLQVVDTTTLSYTRCQPEYRIFKLELTGTAKWCEVKSLCGDDALMLSPARAFCISTRDFPELQANCIYSTLSLEPENAMHVYSLKCGGVVRFLPLPRRTRLPNWFTPSLST